MNLYARLFEFTRCLYSNIRDAMLVARRGGRWRCTATTLQVLYCKGEAQKGHREGRGATLAALRWSVAYRNNFARS